MVLHRLQPSPLDQQALDLEISLLLKQLQTLLNESLQEVFLFGSAGKGVQEMHLFSDVDFCVVVSDAVKVKDLYGKMPISKIVPVDWIIVNKSDFDKKVGQGHGVYALVFQEGHRLLHGEPR